MKLGLKEKIAYGIGAVGMGYGNNSFNSPRL